MSLLRRSMPNPATASAFGDLAPSQSVSEQFSTLRDCRHNRQSHSGDASPGLAEPPGSLNSPIHLKPHARGAMIVAIARGVVRFGGYVELRIPRMGLLFSRAVSIVALG